MSSWFCNACQIYTCQVRDATIGNVHLWKNHARTSTVLKVLQKQSYFFDCTLGTLINYESTFISTIGNTPTFAFKLENQ